MNNIARYEGIITARSFRSSSRFSTISSSRVAAGSRFNKQDVPMSKFPVDPRSRRGRPRHPAESTAPCCPPPPLSPCAGHVTWHLTPGPRTDIGRRGGPLQRGMQGAVAILVTVHRHSQNSGDGGDVRPERAPGGKGPSKNEK